MKYNSQINFGKLIVINDAPKFADYLKDLLTEKGYKTIFVDNIEEARKLQEQEEYDSIVFAHELLLTKKSRQKIIEESSLAHGGEFIIINDAPGLVDRIKAWMEKKKYRYVLVDNIDEANRLLEEKDYDIVMYAHEFSFKVNPN